MQEMKANWIWFILLLLLPQALLQQLSGALGGTFHAMHLGQAALQGHFLSVAGALWTAH